MPNDLTSILIPVYNNLQYTETCLKSIFNNVSPVRTPYEVIVYDNGSTDGTTQYLKGLEESGRVKVIFDRKNTGFPFAVNRLAEKAEGKFLWICNNDTIITPNALSNMLRCIRSDNKIAVAGCYTNHGSGNNQSPVECTYKGDEELDAFARKYSQPDKDVDFLVFFSALFRKDIWQEIGGLSEKMGVGNWEDNLYCWQVVKKGYKLKICGNAFIHHFIGKSWQRDKPKKAEFYRKLLAHNQKVFMKEIGDNTTVGLSMVCADTETPKNLRKCLSNIALFVDSINIVFNYKYFPRPWRMKKLLAVVKEFENVTFDNTKLS